MKTMPPLYEEAIVLCVNSEVWIKNYDDVLFSDGSPDAVSSLKIGLGIFELVQNPPPYYPDVHISNYLDVREVIRLQRAIIDQRASQPSTSDAQEYSLRLIFAGLKTIGFAQPGDAEPTTSRALIDNYLGQYAKKNYSRSDWSVSYVGEEKWTYKGPIEGLLSPRQYGVYEDLGFVGYFPKPSFVLQEQQTKLMDTGKLGLTANSDPRSIKRISSRRLQVIRNGWKKKKDEIFPKVDEWITAKEEAKKKEEEAKKKEESQEEEEPKEQDATAPKKLHGDLKRRTCYGFRGDTRGPKQIRASGGFFSNVTRSYVPDYRKTSAANVDKALKTRGGETLFEALLNAGVFNLGSYIINEAFGGFVSTSTSIAVAKSFTNGWHFKARNFPPSNASLEPFGFNSYNFCYAMRCINGFVLPSGAEAKELEKIHEFATKAEQEVAVPGMIGWNEVFGFRLCPSLATGPLLAGPVWILKSMPQIDREGFHKLFGLLSGMSQGKHSEIDDSYGRPNGPDLPFELPLASLPTKGSLIEALNKKMAGAL